MGLERGVVFLALGRRNEEWQSVGRMGVSVRLVIFVTMF
jgi:hypothetical protein